MGLWNWKSRTLIGGAGRRVLVVAGAPGKTGCTGRGPLLAICDTISTITEQLAISFSGFTKAELSQLTFYLVRKGKILKDTVAHYPQRDGLYEFNIPLAFARFKKTDTIVVETAGKDKRFYQLSGFHHYASLHYRMLGYVGDHDYRLAEGAYTVNGRRIQDFLRKQDGLPALVLPTHW